MSERQEQNGKAFEYACFISVHQKLLSKGNTTIRITEDAPFNRAKECFSLLSEIEQKAMLDSADKAFQFIIAHLEPMMHAPPISDVITLSIQPDQKGSEGDVRDLIMVRNNVGWEIGFSVKHNSPSIKSLRLSTKNDFFSKCGAISSPTYKDKIKSAFDYVGQNKGKIWSEQGSDKEEKHYIPLLNALIDEFHDQISNEDFARNLMLLIIGKTDHYRVSRRIKGKNTKTIVEAININGSLNKPYNNIEASYKAPMLVMPSKVEKIEFKAKEVKDTVIVGFNNGLEMLFRIHNDHEIVGKTNPKLEWSISKYPEHYYLKEV